MNIDLIKHTVNVLPKVVLWKKFKKKLFNKLGLHHSFFPNLDLDIINENVFSIDFNNFGTNSFHKFLNDFFLSVHLNENTNENELRLICDFLENKIEIFGFKCLLTEDFYYNFNTDFINNYTWEKSQNKVKIVGDQGYDIKTPWEIGRLQFITQILILVNYKLKDEDLVSINTNKEEIIDKIKWFLSQFIHCNLVGYGTQWMSAMDVSIRLVNLLFTYHLLQNSIEKDNFKTLIEKSIFEHIRFVLEHLEWSDGMRANHYYSNITSLSISLLYIKSTNTQNQDYETLLLGLQKFAINELIKETFYQFNDEGSNFEDSFPYHFLQVEFLLFALSEILSLNTEQAQKIKSATLPYNTINNEDYLNNSYGSNTFNNLKSSKGTTNFGSTSLLPDKFYKLLLEIYNFTTEVLNQKLEIKQIGDNDSGRFIKFDSQNNSLDFSSRKLFFEFILEEIKVKNKTIGLINHYIHSFTPHISNHILPQIPEYEEVSNFDVTAYSATQFGIYKLKNENYEFYLKSSKVGQLGKGGHSHNDNLSFILDILGEEIIVDCGTYTYTKDFKERNVFRQTSSHNVLQIEDVEQNLIKSSNLDDVFWIYSDNCQSRVTVFNPTMLVAENFCYKSVYKRAFLFKSNTIHCKELLDLNTNKSVYFHLHPNSKIKNISENKLEIHTLSTLHPSIIIKTTLEVLDDYKNKQENQTSPIDLMITDYDCSLSYLKKTTAKKVIMTTKRKEINWLISISTFKNLNDKVN